MSVTEIEFGAVEAEILRRAPEHTPQPSLDRTRMVCELLGDPQRAYPVIHIAGTNGKTSTSRMIDRLLREHGLRTGRFTSPHLSHIGERITVDGVRLGEEEFVEAWRDIEPYVRIADERSRAAGGPQLSFFEVLTCMAFAVFADAPVDVAVLETGLGGTWDSTNVADGDVAVITAIAFDHERWLGYTIPEIAAQKAGIMKPGAVAVLATQLRAEAAHTLHRRAADLGVTARNEGEDFGVTKRDLAVGGQRLALRNSGGLIEDIYLPMYGAHQAGNAAVALAAVEAFLVGDSGRRLDEDLVRDAFAHVDSPGRMEVVGRNPLTVIDAAHNPAGAAALAATLPEAFPGASFVAVLGVMADKDAAHIVTALAPAVSTFVVTESASARAMPADDLAAVVLRVAPDVPLIVETDLPAALETAREEAAAAEAAGSVIAAVVVAGSVYLAAGARALLGAFDPDTVAVDTTRRRDDDAGEPGDGDGSEKAHVDDEAVVDEFGDSYDQYGDRFRDRPEPIDDGGLDPRPGER